MKYIDIHCHLDFPNYDKDKEDIFARIRGIDGGAITIGTDLESSKKAVKIAEENDNIWACVGMHPENASPPSSLLHQERGETQTQRSSVFVSPQMRGGRDEVRVGFPEFEFSKLISNPKVVAIGECGLDYFRIKDESEKELQKKLFIEQIEFALKHNKPLMLHCRNAYDDVLEILKNYKNEKLRGNTHFFAGNIEQAKKFLALGFTMSFTGVITFARDYDEVIKYLPLDKIMSETDAPFVAPMPYRGKRNEPAFVVEIVKRLSEIRNVDIDEMKSILIRNTVRLFELKIEN
ncbi:MAG: TatD family hydrolase [Patescibacteria group bacterium]